jgi:hypothetical protein
MGVSSMWKCPKIPVVQEKVAKNATGNADIAKAATTGHRSRVAKKADSAKKAAKKGLASIS